MISYYTSIIILTWMALGILCILIRENNRITKEDKRLFYFTYVLIALSALAEWIGIQLNGNESFPKWALQLAKCADYILTPMAGGAIVRQMKLRNRGYRLLLIILAANTVFQIISAFTGWMLTVDEQHYYAHGPLYKFYILIYAAVIVLIVAEFLAYGKSFRKQNRLSLYAIMGMVVIGIGMQEILGGDHRTAYLSLSIAAALLFIHAMEFSLQRKDEHILQQQIQITTDALTGVSSRHAYSQALKDYNAAGQLPSDLIAFVIDINELKAVNDTMGHEVGDELICGAAACIEKVFGEMGVTYRTGGDEFVVLAHMKKAEVDAALQNLQKETESWSGELVKNLRLAAGYAAAADHEIITCEELVKQADHAMYAAKAAYYRETGKDRRHR